MASDLHSPNAEFRFTLTACLGVNVSGLDTVHSEEIKERLKDGVLSTSFSYCAEKNYPAAKKKRSDSDFIVINKRHSKAAN